MWYQYEIEISYNNGQTWITEQRWYKTEKDIKSFDLKDILNQRRNAKFINKTKSP